MTTTVCMDLRYLQRACENSRSGGRGGVGTYIANLWNALVARGPDFSLRPLLTRRAPTPEFRTTMRGLDKTTPVTSPLIGHPALPARLSFGKYAPLVRLVESELLLARALYHQRVDIVHDPDQGLPPPGRFGKVVTVHDIPVWKDVGQRKLRQFYLRRTLRRADRLVCDSRSTAQDLLTFAPDVLIR